MAAIRGGCHWKDRCRWYGSLRADGGLAWQKMQSLRWPWVCWSLQHMTRQRGRRKIQCWKNCWWRPAMIRCLLISPTRRSSGTEKNGVSSRGKCRYAGRGSRRGSVDPNRRIRYGWNNRRSGYRRYCSYEKINASQIWMIHSVCIKLITSFLHHTAKLVKICRIATAKEQIQETMRQVFKVVFICDCCRLVGISATIA